MWLSGDTRGPNIKEHPKAPNFSGDHINALDAEVGLCAKFNDEFDSKYSTKITDV